MLGSLLEFTIRSEAVASAVDFYRKLGFSELEIGDLSNEPAAALSLRDVTIGLTEGKSGDPVPTFVRPDLKSYLRGLRRQKVELEFAELEDHQFHRAGFRDPNGLLIVLIEARTYAAALDDTVLSVVGEFAEYSVPTRSIDEALEFWEGLGVIPISLGDEPAPWARIQGHGLTLGLHSDARFAPGLTFECDNIEARMAFLEANGCSVASGAPFGGTDARSVVLHAPDRQSLYLFETAQPG